MSSRSPQAELVLVDRREAAALVTLNRPEKRNALSIDLRLRLADVFQELSGDDAVNAIGLTGKGSAFCAGMDVTQFGGDVANRRRLVESSIRCFTAVAECPKPTVALVNGPALGGGFALALTCDVRIAGKSARFGFTELGRGIPPSYAAASAALPPAVAADLCLTGRTITAADALALGVVSRIDDGADVLSEVAAASAVATAEVKRRIMLRRSGMTAAELFAEEEAALREALLGD